jgi:hypothetical protein
VVTTLHERIEAAVRERMAVAQAATPGPWSVDNHTYAETITAGDGYTEVIAGGRWGGEASVFHSTEDAIHIAANDPARILRDCAEDLAALGRHRPDEHRQHCFACPSGIDWRKCPEVLSLARRYGITEEAQ